MGRGRTQHQEQWPALFRPLTGGSPNQWSKEMQAFIRLCRWYVVDFNVIIERFDRWLSCACVMDSYLYRSHTNTQVMSSCQCILSSDCVVNIVVDVVSMPIHWPLYLINGRNIWQLPQWTTVWMPLTVFWIPRPSIARWSHLLGKGTQRVVASG